MACAYSSDRIYGTFGSLAKVVPTMDPQNILVSILPILSLVPPTVPGSPQPFSDLDLAYTVQGWFCLLAK